MDRAIFLTAAMTGMRQGELLALRWSDIDWQATHTFGTRMAASPKVSMRRLQEWMGHRDLRTTQIYTDYEPGASS